MSWSVTIFLPLPLCTVLITPVYSSVLVLTCLSYPALNKDVITISISMFFIFIILRTAGLKVVHTPSVIYRAVPTPSVIYLH